LLMRVKSGQIGYALSLQERAIELQGRAQELGRLEVLVSERTLVDE
jgi:hypothetical protein